MPDPGTTPIRPDSATRAEEQQDAQVRAGADRPPTDEEAHKAEQQSLDPDVAEHEREMAERGAHQEGEGRIT
jgi:hypothetical protein